MKLFLFLCVIGVVVLIETNPTTDEYLSWLQEQLMRNDSDIADRALISLLGGPFLRLQTTREDHQAFSVFRTEIDDNTKLTAVGFLHHFIPLPNVRYKSAWTPGRALPGHPHVVAANEEGHYLPEDGYTWVANPPLAGDFRIKWQPGRMSNKYRHVVASDVEGRWRPEDGYTWVASPPVDGDFRVRWLPGARSSHWSHIYADVPEGHWLPDVGYAWLNPSSSGDYRVQPIEQFSPQPTINQWRAGCSYVANQLLCPSPGPGLCWEESHNPYLDQPPLLIDIGNDANSPDYGHPERCSTAP